MSHVTIAELGFFVAVTRFHKKLKTNSIFEIQDVLGI